MASPYNDADTPAPLYLANDDEWEAQMDEQQRDLLQADEQAEQEDVAQSDAADLVQPIRLHLSDVPDSAYWDDSALTSCFTAALADYKFQHPALFGPPREAPRSQAQKHSFAPLWYGAAPILPASGTSTTSSTKSSKKAKAKAKAKRAAVASLPAPPPAPKRTKTLHISTPSSPKYAPASPEFQRALSLEAPPQLGDALTAGPRLPSPTSFTPPPLPSSATSSSLPTHFPPPPPLVELTAEDVAATIGAGEGAKETPEELLQAALWAWYNAGYQTGLYHAAVGVAGVAEGEGE